MVMKKIRNDLRLMRPTSVARWVRGERRRGREERPERSAAVYIFEAVLTATENIGHRKPGRRTNLAKNVIL